MLDATRDELVKTKSALAEVRSREECVQREKNRLLEELAQAKAKQQEYATVIEHGKEVAIAELESARALFSKKLKQSVEDRFALESKLILAKHDALELAIQVEKLAEIAFQQATSRVLEDARLRVAAAETSAAQAAYRIEEEIRNVTEKTISSMISQSTDTINKTLEAAKQATTHAQMDFSSVSGDPNVVHEIDILQTDNMGLKNTVNTLESQLSIAKLEVEKLRSELEHALALTGASDARASAAEEALADLQDKIQKSSTSRENEIKALLEKVNREAVDKEKAAREAFKTELESIMGAIEAAKETANLKDRAFLRRCKALERSLSAAEATSEAWRQRAETAESILQIEGAPLEKFEIGSGYSSHGGRIDLLVRDDLQKRKLLVDGPRREIPEWMSGRIKAISPNFPPREADIEKVLSAQVLSLSIPLYEEVWSIVQEQPSETDVLIEQVTEKVTIEKKRKLLERVLQRKTGKWQRIPEKIKLEPGTGTGREIVFQGFNWESWRRSWYLEVAQKAADLSNTGITAIWLPPPTESVAPQGYLPSDLYNLNSAYGTVDELKQCIEEMHNRDLLALGDVVLNHRCAQKQNANGVWNIFGGKLAWGPEAIVCDDPNFQGCGNPSTGDFFHAAPNIDHSQEFVRSDIKNWLNWLKNDIGFDGWRLDFVRGFSGVYVKEYIEASHPAFAIGEYWDSLDYGGGDLSYNQDAHRQRIVNWINATGGTSSAFDVTTKGILHCALHNQYWRLIDPQGKPTGVMGWWPSRAVTFLENHDTGSTQAHWPFPREKLGQGYAYILTHPGTPTVFFDHFYDFGLRDTITELIEVRRRAGIHCRSNVKIFHANNEGYVARMDESLVVKLGHFDWSPSKENNLEGTWNRFLDRGSDYQVWLRE